MGDGAAVSGAFIELDAIPAKRGAQHERSRGSRAGDIHPLLPSPLQRGIHTESEGVAVLRRPTLGDRPCEESQTGASGRRGVAERRGIPRVPPRAGCGRAIAMVVHTAVAYAKSDGKGMPAAAGGGIDIPRSGGSIGCFDFDRGELRGSGDQEVSAGGSQIQ